MDKSTFIFKKIYEFNVNNRTSRAIIEIYDQRFLIIFVPDEISWIYDF
jgi:hypothetical protein